METGCAGRSRLFSCLQIGAAGLVEEAAVNPTMEPPAGGVIVRVVAHPAVVMDGGVQRLRGVADQMAHDAHHIDDVRLGVGDFLGRAGFFIGLEIGKAGFQLANRLRDRPRQKPHQPAGVVLVVFRLGLGKLLRVRLADEGELGHEVVPENRQHLGLEAVVGQLFHVHVMVRETVMFERQVGRVAPAVHLARQEGDALGSGGFAHEGREVGRQGGERQLVDDAVALIIPRPGEVDAELEERQECQCGSR